MGSWGFSSPPLKLSKHLGLGWSVRWAQEMATGYHLGTIDFLVKLLVGYDKHCLANFGQDQQASVWKPDGGRRRRADAKGQKVRELEKLSQRKPALRKALRARKDGGRERKGSGLGNHTGAKCLRGGNLSEPSLTRMKTG